VTLALLRETEKGNAVNDTRTVRYTDKFCWRTLENSLDLNTYKSRNRLISKAIFSSFIIKTRPVLIYTQICIPSVLELLSPGSKAAGPVKLLSMV
jgi:hypothetical protein